MSNTHLFREKDKKYYCRYHLDNIPNPQVSLYTQKIQYLIAVKKEFENAMKSLSKHCVKNNKIIYTHARAHTHTFFDKKIKRKHKKFINL